MKAKKLIIIAGPTAIGKSSLAIRLAKKLGAEIFSADSRQVYKELSIGTAKPLSEELKEVRHHMIDVVSIQDSFDVFDYERMTIRLLKEYFESHQVAILVGGTGLYIKAIQEGLNEFPDVPEDVQKEVEADYEAFGITKLQSSLELLDPVYYKTVDLKNPRRLIRALSVIKSSGKPFSSFRNQTKVTRSFDCIPILLETDRTVLYTRINERVDKMMADGLLDEVKGLDAYKDLRSLQTIGYKELFSYLAGVYDQQTAVEKIKQHTRNYAKRQLTWFNNNYAGTRFQPAAESQIFQFIEEQIN